MDKNWNPINKQDSYLKLDWGELCVRRFADPYLIWADVTKFAGYLATQSDQQGLKIQVALSLAAKTPVAPPKNANSNDIAGIPIELLLLLFPDLSSVLPINSVFLGSLADTDTLFATARLPKKRFVELYQKLLDCEKQISARIELGVPLYAPPIDVKTNIPDDNISPLSGNVLVVIDDGCPFARQQLLKVTAGKLKAKVRFFLDQGNQPHVAPWVSPTGFGYGRELTGGEIDKLIEQHQHDGIVDEAAVYKAVDYRVMQTRETHGAHVLDIAAGIPNPLVAGLNEPVLGDLSIIFVQLPREAVADTSGGSMNVFVHDALQYALSRVTDDARVTVNLSYGTFAGPHDGQSLIEQFMDARLKTRNNTAIILPAGNSYNSMCHARKSIRSGDVMELEWEVAPNDPTDSFMEIWCDTENHDLKNIGLRVTIQAPDESVQAVRTDTAFLYKDQTNTVKAAVFNTSSSPLGKGPMALCAIAPTAIRQDGSLGAPSGVWKVQISHNCSKAVQIDAWIERDDSAYGDPWPARQSRLVVRQDQNPDPQLEYSDGTPAKKEATLSSFCTGMLPIVVGADVLDSGELTEYSAAGPGRLDTRPNGPDLLASADESETLKGRLAGGNLSGVEVRRNGTSVAAPQVARAMVQFLAKQQLPITAEKLKEKFLASRAPGSQPPAEDKPPRRGSGRLKR